MIKNNYFYTNQGNNTQGRLAMRNLTYTIFIQDFHSEAYQFTEKDRLFTAFNDYLDSSVVLPSGN